MSGTVNRRTDRRPGSARMTDIAGPVVVFVMFIGLWYLVSEVLLPSHKRFLLPAPHTVVREGFLVWRQGDRRGLQPILVSLWDSSKVALTGLCITIVFGILLALLMSTRRWIEKATWPYLVAVQSAPVLALTPLIRALIDGSTTQRVLVVVLISVFPVVSNTLFGLLSADRGQHDLFTLHGAKRLTRLLKLQLPSALPSIFVGLRSAAGLSVIGAVVGDFYFRGAGVVGIGAQIDVYRQRLWGSELIASIILASALGLTVFLVFGWLSRKVIGRWHEPERGQ
ncbi:MAG: hypothetical protein RLZZ305_1105 [Actinomycetota bacterium]